jgi:hypothetical protein
MGRISTLALDVRRLIKGVCPMSGQLECGSLTFAVDKRQQRQDPRPLNRLG